MKKIIIVGTLYIFIPFYPYTLVLFQCTQIITVNFE